MFIQCSHFQILEEASRKTGLSTTTFRVGQLCGGGNGSWAVTDWVPIILASSIYLGYLPDAMGVRHTPSHYIQNGLLMNVRLSIAHILDTARHRCQVHHRCWNYHELCRPDTPPLSPTSNPVDKYDGSLVHCTGTGDG